MRYRDSSAQLTVDRMLVRGHLYDLKSLLLTNDPFPGLPYRKFSEFQIKNLFRALDSPRPIEGCSYYEEFHQLMGIYTEQNKF
jgi:hypothetical protein